MADESKARLQELESELASVREAAFIHEVQSWAESVPEPDKQLAAEIAVIRVELFRLRNLAVDHITERNRIIWTPVAPLPKERPKLDIPWRIRRKFWKLITKARLHPEKASLFYGEIEALRQKW